MEAPSFNHWTILFAFIALQGFILSVVIYKKYEADPKRNLALVIGLFSVMLCYYVLFWTGYVRQLPREIAVAGLLTYLIGPLIFQYVQNDDSKQPLHKAHFIPFALLALIFFTAPLWRSQTDGSGIISAGLLQTLHLVIYAFLILRASKRYSSAENKFIAISFIIYSFSFLSYYVLFWSDYLKVEHDYFISIVSSIMIYGIGYFVLFAPKQSSNKYEHSSLDATATTSVLASIKTFVVRTKAYQNSEFRLNQLADELGYSTNHVSQAINMVEGKNFAEFINTYRIAEACRLIQAADSKPKMIQIAFDVGFNNKTSFYNAFMKIKGCSPTEYYNTLLRSIPA